ncbi:hypothetical protein JMUB5695_00558 [Mycobacterium heckeshornense]|nr:hypothetical protein JMUB5695_00558 [Mycobacterium heckeshornense]
MMTALAFDGTLTSGGIDMTILTSEARGSMRSTRPTGTPRMRT